MSDIFGKVVAILLCAWLMFLYPLQQLKEENKQLERMYIYQESVRVLDAARNTGKIISEGWLAYEKKISNMNELYEIELFHEKVNGEGEMTDYEYYYHEQIEEQLREQGEYLLGYNDFIKIVVKNSEKQMIVCYGGSVKVGGEDETD